MLVGQLGSVHQPLVMKHPVAQCANEREPTIKGANVSVAGQTVWKDALGEMVTETCLRVMLVEERGPEAERQVTDDGGWGECATALRKFLHGQVKPRHLSLGERQGVPKPSGVTGLVAECSVDAISQRELDDLKRRKQRFADRRVEKMPSERVAMVRVSERRARQRLKAQ